MPIAGQYQASPGSDMEIDKIECKTDIIATTEQQIIYGIKLILHSCVLRCIDLSLVTLTLDWPYIGWLFALYRPDNGAISARQWPAISLMDHVSYRFIINYLGYLRYLK